MHTNHPGQLMEPKKSKEMIPTATRRSQSALPLPILCQKQAGGSSGGGGGDGGGDGDGDGGDGGRRGKSRRTPPTAALAAAAQTMPGTVPEQILSCHATPAKRKVTGEGSTHGQVTLELPQNSGRPSTHALDSAKRAKPSNSALLPTPSLAVPDPDLLGSLGNHESVDPAMDVSHLQPHDQAMGLSNADGMRKMDSAGEAGAAVR